MKVSPGTDRRTSAPRLAAIVKHTIGWETKTRRYRRSPLHFHPVSSMLRFADSGSDCLACPAAGSLLCPLCPFRPPGEREDFFFSGRTTCGPSDEGGLQEFVESAERPAILALRVLHSWSSSRGLPTVGSLPESWGRPACGLSIGGPFPELSHKRVAMDILNGAVWFTGLVEFASTGGFSGKGPVGGPVAGSFEPFGIDKGLNPAGRVRMERLPVSGNPPRTSGQKIGAGMRDMNPGRNQKAGVVSERAAIFSPEFLSPADKIGPIAQDTMLQSKRQGMPAAGLRKKPCT